MVVTTGYSIMVGIKLYLFTSLSTRASKVRSQVLHTHTHIYIHIYIYLQFHYLHLIVSRSLANQAA